MDSCTHKCILSFMELFYKNMGHDGIKPRLTLADMVKASISIRLSKLKNSLSKFDQKELVLCKLQYLILVVREFRILK